MIGDKIRELRKKRGMTQEELAERVNVVRQTVSKWEKNLSVPDADILQRLCDVLDVDVKYILGDENGEKDSDIVNELVRLNTQLSIRNRRAKLIFRCIICILAIIAVFNIIQIIGGSTFYVNENIESTIETIKPIE